MTDTLDPTLDMPAPTGDMHADQTALDIGDPADAGDDPAAPYGRRADGKPRKRPARAYDLMRTATAKGRSGRKSSSTRATKSTTAKKAAPRKAPANVDFGKLAGEVIDNLVIAPLLGAAVITQADVFYADTYAVTLHRDAVAGGLAEAAKRSPIVAGALTRVAVVAPAVGIMTALSQLGMQLAVNHGRMRAGFMGTVPPELLAAAGRADLDRQAAEAAEAAGVAYPPPPPPPYVDVDEHQGDDAGGPEPWPTMAGDAVA